MCVCDHNVNILRLNCPVPLPKKKRDDSPSVHSIPSTSNLSCSSKTRGHIPVSERQQFALLKLMETKEPSSERGGLCCHFIIFASIYYCGRAIIVLLRSRARNPFNRIINVEPLICLLSSFF